MYNLLKSDLYRLVHGKMLWVALGCLVVLAAGSGWFVWFGTTLPGASTTSELAWDSRTHTYAQLLIEGGVLPIIVSIVVALLFAGDYETGFAKSVFAGRPRRAPYFVERLALCGLLCAAFLLAGAFVADASFAVFGSAYQRVETVGEYWTWLGLAWLEAVAYVLMTALVAWSTRSKAAAVVFAVAIPLGLPYWIVALAASSLQPAVPVLADLASWLPTSSAHLLGSGGVGLFAPVGDAALSGLSVPAHIALVSCVVAAACCAISLAVCRRRDV